MSKFLSVLALGMFICAGTVQAQGWTSQAVGGNGAEGFGEETDITGEVLANCSNSQRCVWNNNKGRAVYFMAFLQRNGVFRCETAAYALPNKSLSITSPIPENTPVIYSGRSNQGDDGKRRVFILVPKNGQLQTRDWGGEQACFVTRVAIY
jgi:hypothetical protein